MAAPAHYLAEEAQSNAKAYTRAQLKPILERLEALEARVAQLDKRTIGQMRVG